MIGNLMISDSNLALYIGQRVLADVEKLRLFMPDCFARIPLTIDGHHYEIRVIQKEKALDER